MVPKGAEKGPEKRKEKLIQKELKAKRPFRSLCEEMPRRIKSLKDATLFAIAKNIKYWGDMIPEDPDTYLYLLSPFEVLGTFVSNCF